MFPHSDIISLMPSWWQRTDLHFLYSFQWLSLSSDDCFVHSYFSPPLQAKYLAQIIVMGAQVVGRAFARALRQEYAGMIHDVAWKV